MNDHRHHRKRGLTEERTFKPNHPHTFKNLLSRQFYNHDYELHNPNGPAILIYNEGDIVREEYWLNDKRCTKEDILKIVRKNKLKEIEKKSKIKQGI